MACVHRSFIFLVTIMSIEETFIDSHFFLNDVQCSVHCNASHQIMGAWNVFFSRVYVLSQWFCMELLSKISNPSEQAVLCIRGLREWSRAILWCGITILKWKGSLSVCMFFVLLCCTDVSGVHLFFFSWTHVTQGDADAVAIKIVFAVVVAAVLSCVFVCRLRHHVPLLKVC